MSRHFDSDLPRVGADKLKPMVKLWGGDSKMRKDECIACIVAGLKDPQKVRAAIASLQPWERNALALIKLMGGIIPTSALKIGILASGLHPPRTYGYRDDFTDPLFRRGLLMGMSSYNPEYLTEQYGSGILYSDERILAHVGFPEYLPLNIQPISPAGEMLFRRPSAVTLDIIGILQAIENMGSLKLTQNGDVRVNDEIKLRKSLHWEEQGMELDGFFFPNPVQAWLSAFLNSDILKQANDHSLVAQESPDHFAQRPHGEQVRLLMEGLIRSKNWWETQLPKTYLDNDGKTRRQGRLALDLALSALPLNPDYFFSFDDFEQALYKRIGEDFALDYPPQRPYYFRSTTPEQHRQELAAWQEKTRAEWLNQERPWLEGAFTTWLYFLGLVELATENGKMIGFRLTDLGRSTFHPELASTSLAESAPPDSAHPAWVVQPNFDIIAYLEYVTAPQLAFLERHAERTQSQRHTAHYRLTRESVYRGLESGTTLNKLFDRLKTGSQVELPQNVMVELREWASLRERIVLRRHARMLEFSSAKALQNALTLGLSGSIVDERFLLLAQNKKPNAADSMLINYAQPLPPNLNVFEDGKIHLKRGNHDLITAAQLSQWAAHSSDLEWQLTAESVSATLSMGRKVTELLSFIKSRSAHPLPPLLEIALRSWAGETYQVELESAIILRCPEEHIFNAIIASPMMKPYLKGYLYPDFLFVDAQKLESLQAQLKWLGWKVFDQLQIIPFNGKK